MSRGAPLEEMLEQNRALQEELRRIVEVSETVRQQNEEKQRLCASVIQTRQQQAKTRRTARPVKAPSTAAPPGSVCSGLAVVLLCGGLRTPCSAAQMNCSFWTCDGHAPKLSHQSRHLQRILAHVPPSFRNSFAWTAQETQSLCYATLSLAQEKLSQRVFAASMEDPDFTVEMLRAGIEESRRVRLDSEVVLGTVREFDLEDWERVSERLKEKRSALECLIQWTAFVRPDRNQKPFTQAEAAALKCIAEGRALAHWEEIAAELGTGRHPTECLKYYRQHFSIPNRRWEKEDDDRILQTWQQGGTHALKLLNMELERDFRVLLGRLRFLLKKQNFKKGKWSAAEDVQLLKAVLRHGMCWESVSADVCDRSAPQCRERFAYSLQPSLRRRRNAEWKAEETEKLKVQDNPEYVGGLSSVQVLAEEHLQQYGKIKWAHLAEQFVGLSPRDLLNKWNSLMEQNGS